MLSFDAPIGLVPARFRPRPRAARRPQPAPPWEADDAGEAVAVREAAPAFAPREPAPLDLAPFVPEPSPERTPARDALAEARRRWRDCPVAACVRRRKCRFKTAVCLRDNQAIMARVRRRLEYLAGEGPEPEETPGAVVEAPPKEEPRRERPNARRRRR